MLSSGLHLPRGAAEILRTARSRVAGRAESQDRGGQPWYRIEAKADTAELYIFDEISIWGVTAADFVRDLTALDVSSLVLHLNSPGGWVDDGIAIHNALRDHRADVEVRVDGLAASIASVIAMAGDRVVMNRHSMLMIHDAAVVLDVLGNFNAAQLEQIEREVVQLREAMDRTSDVIAGVYTARAGGTAAEWRARMRAETWYTADEAVSAGLADEAVATSAGSNSTNKFDLSIFQHPPAHLLPNQAPAPGEVTKRIAERALRDAGLSRAAAMAVLAGGWDEATGDARDARALEDLPEFIRSLSGRSVA